MNENMSSSDAAPSAPHSLPELEQIAAAERELKIRGRRRLIGAGTLGLLSVIFLPMFFDTEPRSDKKPVGNSKEITITIPQREGLSPLPPPVTLPGASAAPIVLGAAPLAAQTAQIVPDSANSAAPAKADANSVMSAQPKVEVAAPIIAGAVVAAGVASVAGAVAASKSAATSDKPVPEVVQSKPALVVPAPPAKVAQVAAAAPAPATVKATPKPVPAPALAPAKVAPAPVVAQAAPAPISGGFVVQLGSFSDDYNIRTLTDRMKSGKLPIYAEKIQITSAGKLKTVTRLRVGPYPTMEKANAIAAKVKALGVTSTVVAN